MSACICRCHVGSAGVGYVSTEYKAIHIDIRQHCVYQHLLSLSINSDQKMSRLCFITLVLLLLDGIWDAHCGSKTLGIVLYISMHAVQTDICNGMCGIDSGIGLRLKWYL